MGNPCRPWSGSLVLRTIMLKEEGHSLYEGKTTLPPSPGVSVFTYPGYFSGTSGPTYPKSTPDSSTVGPCVRNLRRGPFSRWRYEWVHHRPSRIKKRSTTDLWSQRVVYPGTYRRTHWSPVPSTEGSLFLPHSLSPSLVFSLFCSTEILD